MKFESKSVDLDLDLTLLDGTSAFLEGPKNLSASGSLGMLSKWADYDKAFNDANEGKSVEFMDIAKHNDHWLCEMYVKEDGFFLANISLPTMNEIKAYLTEQLSNVKKN
jgi:hypothetical protein